MTTPTNAGSGVATTLREIARELREHPEHWTQGASARDSKGEPTDATSKSAVCWCALGLTERPGSQPDLYRWLRDATEDFVSRWNDHPTRTASEVADAFDKAAEIAESQP